jgi:hypothetical protein
MDKELFGDLHKINFKKGNKTKGYKYKATIPKDVWNKHRDDKVVNDKVVKFGKPPYQQYYDVLEGWEKYNHQDEKRRELYKKRHSKIMMEYNGEQVPAYKVPFSAEFFSTNFLW